MARGKCRLVSRRIIITVLVLLMFLGQYFYNHYKNTGWQVFFYAYIPAVALLVYQQIEETPFALDTLHSMERELDGENSTKTETLKRFIGSHLKMFTWLLYVIPSIFQFVWILSEFADGIETVSFFGPRFFRIILCFPSGVFLLLDTIEYAAKPDLNVEWWRVFDLFDTVELLQILLVDNGNYLPINQAMKIAMLFFGSISLLFPAFSLWELHACRKIPSGARRPSYNEQSRLISRVRIASKLCQLIFVNIAFLAIRLVLFFKFKLDASVFVAKNTVAIIVGGIEIFSGCRTKEQIEPKERVTLRSTVQNPAFETELDGPNDTSSEKITVSCSTKGEPCSPMQIPGRKFDPGVCSSGGRRAMESNPLSLASLPKTIRLDESSPFQNLRRENLDLSGVNRVPLSSDTGAKESNPPPLPGGVTSY